MKLELLKALFFLTIGAALSWLYLSDNKNLLTKENSATELFNRNLKPILQKAANPNAPQGVKEASELFDQVAKKMQEHYPDIDIKKVNVENLKKGIHAIRSGLTNSLEFKSIEKSNQFIITIITKSFHTESFKFRPKLNTLEVSGMRFIQHPDDPKRESQILVKEEISIPQNFEPKSFKILADKAQDIIQVIISKK